MKYGSLRLLLLVTYGAQPAHRVAHVFSRAGRGRGLCDGQNGIQPAVVNQQAVGVQPCF